MKTTAPNNEKVKNQLHETVTYIGDMFHELESLRAENKALREKLRIQEGAPFSDSFDVLAVTNVQVFTFNGSVNMGRMKALANIVLNDQFQIRGLRVMEGEFGLYVGYPNDPFYKGEDFRAVANPVTRTLREHIENCVLEKYAQVTE